MSQKSTLSGREQKRRWHQITLTSLGLMLLAAVLLAAQGLHQATPPTATQLDDPKFVSQIKTFIEQLVAEEEFSGTVLVAKDGQPIFEGAYGLASRAYQVPNRIDTKFNLGSMNKMFTAVAIAQLAEAGKLAYDDPIAKHLPAYPNQEVAKQVTIHHLLTHTSGLPDFFNAKFMDASRAKFREVADFLPLFVEESLLFTPGAEWSYSNSNFIVLGLIVEAVSGENYFNYVQKHIYQPAGMLNTDAYEMDRDTPNLAIGYTRSPEGEIRNNLFEHVIKGGPAGGGFSTVQDLWRFAQALTSHKLLSAQETEIITTGKVEVPGPPDAFYAYGFSDEKFHGHRRFGHGGGFTGINAKLDIYPDLGYVVVVMANMDPPAADRVADRIGKLLAGVTIPQPIPLASAKLANYANTYAVQGGGPGLEILVDRGRLWLIMGPARHKLLPLSEAEFFDADFEDIRFHFQFDKQGKATAFTVTGMGPQPEKFVVVPREVVYPKAITLPVSQLANYVNTYKRKGSGVGFESVEIVLEQNALWLLDDNGRHKFQPLSETEFFDELSTGVHLHFQLNEKGQATALSIKGLGPELDNEIFVVKN